MKKFIILLALMVIAIGCRSSKTDEREESQLKQTENFIKSSREGVDIGLNQEHEDYNLQLNKFGYNITLQAKDSATPARLTEYRNGLPYRTLETTGTYTENKSVKDSSINKDYIALNSKFNRLNLLYRDQSSEIIALSSRFEKSKIEGKALANNFKYLLWFLLTFAGIWIAERAGFFLAVKRLLKRRLRDV